MTPDKHVTGSEFFIVDLSNGRRLASYDALNYQGGWLYRALADIGMTGPHCPETASQFSYSKFILGILKPLASKE